MAKITIAAITLVALFIELYEPSCNFVRDVSVSRGVFKIADSSKCPYHRQFQFKKHFKKLWPTPVVFFHVETPPNKYNMLEGFEPDFHHQLYLKSLDRPPISPIAS